ncbi:CST complex subunit CTC1 isoform X3 [Ziziphus jujuba]|uniref:CST complex subunit CTC1 n=1 Tax=Ziziphus jujuba TaxID=326968 RepID=A0A6P4A9F6_ZIZJJ|nr:CST complex subunit CTC1 isoform X3 [Ziziphus jujuba]
MENSKVLTIRELVHGGCPLTATSSPHSLPSKHTTPFPSASTNPNPNPDAPKVLIPLDQPASIVGTLTLPDSTTLRCSCNSCFHFSDGSATVCCDILHLDLRILGKKIRVLAWNFLPFKRGGGFLEIIRWSFPDSDCGPSLGSNVGSFPLTSGSSSVCEDSSKSRYRLHGVLESISPISVVPCTSGFSKSKSTVGSNSTPSTNLQGFLVQILVCECKFCRLMDNTTQEHRNHSFTKSMFLYFCGSASSWHPVFTKLIGNVVCVSGLKKKLVYIGKEESRLMYTTTEKTTLHLLGLLHKKHVQNEKTSIKGKGECGAYIGIVRGIYMQGMVVELDNEVWLLLTDQLLTRPHSVRVGALISVRNVHFVNPKFSWTKMLILGACFKTSITVERFSPLETGCHLLPESQSMLGNFVGSLAFSARLWVLLLVSCFRKKFAGFLSEKEILGSKHKEGLVQMYASSHLPSSTIRSRHGVFMTLCKHDTCGSECERYSGNLKLVVPLFSFIRHFQDTWIRNLHLGNDNKILSNKILQDNNQHSLLSCEGRSYGQSIRKVFPSEDIGIVLIGSLKISPSSGRLQLVDATASIDVLIPDLSSTWNSNNIYEVIDYSLVIEGMPGQLDHMGLIENELFSCRSVFHFTQLAREVDLTVYIYFCLGSATCRNIPFYPRKKEECQRPESGIFHMLYITHKFPVLQKFQAHTGISDSSSAFVEALILSLNLFLPGEDEIKHLTKDSGDWLRECMEYCDDGNRQGHSSLKRHKVNHESSWAFSGLLENPCKPVREVSACSNSCVKPNEKQKNCNLTSHEVSCLAAIRGVNNHSGVYLVNLNCTRAMSSSQGFCRPIASKVMLEFRPESYYKYQLLQIGCYYITNHDKEDSFCNLMDSGDVSGVKILVTSRIHLWSLSFVSDEVLKNCISTNCLPSVGPSCIGDELLCNTEVFHKMFNDNSLETHSDVSLFLPINIINIIKPSIKEMDENIIPAVTPEGIAEVSPSSGTVVPFPLFLPKSKCLLPEGNLKSLRGNVLAVHGVDHNSVDATLSCQNLAYSLQSRFFHGFASSSCIHILVDNQIVSISGALSKHAFPVGFGPGVDATFHRVLELGGQNVWILTPVSFIVINSIEVVNACGHECSDQVSSMHDASLDTVSSSLIFQLLQRFDCNPTLSHCRVVAVSFMVLEKKNRKDVNLQPKFCSRQDLFDIQLACFVLDDGSSLCCCWADAERAATLLRLHEKLPQKAFENDETEKENSASSTNMSCIERILKNYDRITVKNYGSLFDSLYQDLDVSVSPENALSSSDEGFVKSLVFNACFGTQWRIVASLMDLDAVRQLTEENLLETQPNLYSMPHIWAKEVHNTHPYTEVRNMIQELLDS